MLYGTSAGHSAKVAAAAAETLLEAGLLTETVNAAQRPPDADAYDAVLVVAPVHAGNYPPAVRSWVRRHARALNAQPSAFVSVCLGVLQGDPKVQRDLDDIRQRFLAKTGWTPNSVTAVAGALMYSRYNLVERIMMKRIAAQAGGSTDTSRDVEYTDWAELERFVRGFAGRLKVP